MTYAASISSEFTPKASRIWEESVFLFFVLADQTDSTYLALAVPAFTSLDLLGALCAETGPSGSRRHLVLTAESRQGGVRMQRGGKGRELALELKVLEPSLSAGDHTPHSLTSNTAGAQLFRGARVQRS